MICEEVINCVASMEKIGTNFSSSQDLLATAHLWHGICVIEEMLSNVNVLVTKLANCFILINN